MTVEISSSSLHDKAAEFARVASAARGALSEAVDLILIHNEREVRGTQPRSSLNPVTVLLAVAAWERLVADVNGLARDADWAGPGFARPPDRAALLDVASSVLGPASGGRLPTAWRVQAYRGWRGKRPNNAMVLSGADVAENGHDELAAVVRDYVNLRHAVAHRAYPQHAYPDSAWNGDATSDTVQAGAARAALALFIQLVEQSIHHIGLEIAEHDPSLDVDALSVPTWWFRTSPPDGVRGVAVPGELWGSVDLIAGRDQ